MSICEDFWYDDEIMGTKFYCGNPVDQLARQGCEVFLNISASPFNAGKRKSRYDLFSRIVQRYGAPLVYVNQVGGNDELLFDGSSIVINAQGDTIHCAAAFEETATLVALSGSPCESVLSLPKDAEIGRALILGLRDYLRKCGFRDVVVGLSGGIDSAVTAAIAVEALGAEHVTGIAMPSKFSSPGSIDDARLLATNLGVAFRIVPIESIYEPYEKAFNELFEVVRFDTTNENVQARIRGNILMAWSNRTGALVLSTGNKSELAVGYCTLYGDMAGGLALLGDVYKTMVYRLANWLNRKGSTASSSSTSKNGRNATRSFLPGMTATWFPASSDWSTRTSSSAARLLPPSGSPTKPSAVGDRCRLRRGGEGSRLDSSSEASPRSRQRPESPRE